MTGKATVSEAVAAYAVTVSEAGPMARRTAMGVVHVTVNGTDVPVTDQRVLGLGLPVTVHHANVVGGTATHPLQLAMSGKRRVMLAEASDLYVIPPSTFWDYVSAVGDIDLAVTRRVVCNGDRDPSVQAKHG